MKGIVIVVQGAGINDGIYHKLKKACKDAGVKYNTVTSYFCKTNESTYTSKTGITLTKTELK
jgi:hypothetical protein